MDKQIIEKLPVIIVISQSKTILLTSTKWSILALAQPAKLET